ncbi:hypothetical protein KQI08_08450 [Paraeggerthella hongkongensis]|uniref:hypothetical protein n=1 Tax=Paraeggerthella hominis TaxID=2897351 RepID=UPI001C109C54|nr:MULTISPECIES: hypothetical protein [Paraeggerthella]MBU5405938.1 hypothetical protein [Paraeggerthella hongkongensis]MCD2433786.1 hypothetical protein [Paraeggerthella hominis]
MKNKSILDNPIVQALSLFFLLMAIGLVTRFPAHQFPQIYALHGVLTAPFFSIIALWHLNRQGSILTLLVATLALAAVLGSMSITMGLSFALLAICLLATYGFLWKLDFKKRRFWCAVAFGGLDYPCTLFTGVALGSYAISGDSIVIVLLLSALSIALASFASLLLADKR